MDESNTGVSPADTSSRVRAEILRFLNEERLQPKLDKLKDGEEEAREKLIADHQPHCWIADAARRVSQIQQVTHALKFTNPDAKGSNLSSPGNPHADTLELGSHTLGESLMPDVVGNAAALDVYKFLRLTVEGQTLLDRAIQQDPVLALALSDDADEAARWMSAFATLPQPNGPPSSHKLAKQVYWPLGDGHYHLLAPLFPTALVHRVWSRIRTDRFSEEAKAAREARREQKAHPHGYREYLNLTVQNFGGTKPQNISQLNSERYGENWLLPSLPPSWHSEPLRPPLKTASVFARHFGRRPEVRRLTEALRDFLVRVADANSNIRIRNKRAELIADIRAELLQMAAELCELPAGWSRHKDCHLDLAERCWLDPGRATLEAIDEDFAINCRRGGWRNEICLRFGNWLNAAISTDNSRMGEAEAIAWQRVLDDELRMLRLEIDNHE